jgi:hypothetical protein
VSDAEALLSVLEEIQANSAPASVEVQERFPTRPRVAWLTGDALRKEDDDWQLTEAGRDWGVALPLCSRGERRQQILWDPAVVALLHQTN